MSSKSGLGNLIAAYRTQVILFVSDSVLAPFCLQCSLTCSFSPFFLTRMWCVVAVGGSRSSSTNPGVCVASNCSPWPLYQGEDPHLPLIGILTESTWMQDLFFSECSILFSCHTVLSYTCTYVNVIWKRLSVVCKNKRHCVHIWFFKMILFCGYQWHRDFQSSDA